MRTPVAPLLGARTLGYLGLSPSILVALILLRPNFSSPADRVIDAGIFGLLLAVLIFHPPRIPLKALGPALAFLVFVPLWVVTFEYNLVQHVNYDVRDLFEFYRPFFNVILLFFGLSLDRSYEKDWLRLCLFVLTVEVGLAVLQWKNVGGILQSPLNYIWNMNKGNSLLGRTVGTVTNPNALGFIVNMLMFYLVSEAWYRLGRPPLRLFVLHLAFAFLTSSRTALVIAVATYGILMVSEWRTFSKRLRSNIKIALAALVLSLPFLLPLLLQVLKNFTYVFDMISLLMKGSILQLNTIKLHFKNWSDMFEIIKQHWLLGAGPQKEVLSIGDNDYLFTLMQWGVVGAILKYGLFISLIVLVSRSKIVPWMRSGTIFALVQLFVFGITASSFYDYKYLSLILINTGFAIAMGLESKRKSTL